MTTTTADTPTVARSTNRALVWLERFLALVTVFFALGTVVTVATLPGSLGSAGIGVPATVNPPYSVTTPAGPAFTQGPNSAETPSLAERRTINGRTIDIEDSSLNVTVRVPRGDTDSRLAMSIGVVLRMALWWIGLIAVRRIVHSAREGDPFDHRNVARLRCLAALVVADPVVAGLVSRRLEQTLEWPSLDVTVTTIGARPAAIVALALVALAEIFREGATLRELEQSTI